MKIGSEEIHRFLLVKVLGKGPWGRGGGRPGRKEKKGLSGRESGLGNGEAGCRHKFGDR